MQKIIHHVDYKEEPIVHLSSGEIFAKELLLKNKAHHLLHDNHHAFDLYDIQLVREMPFSDIPLAINMGNHGILCTPEEFIEKAAKRTSVIIEWTESMHGQEIMVDAGNRLMDWRDKYGIIISLDDAGAGTDFFNRFLLSSPDIVKIDGKLITGARRNDLYRMVCGCIVNLCVKNSRLVVAEWIETEEDLIYCRDTLGCPLGQGYFFEQFQRAC